MRPARFGGALARAALLAGLYPAFALVAAPWLGARATLLVALATTAVVMLAGRIAAAPRAQRRSTVLAQTLLLAVGIAFARWLAAPGLLAGALSVWALGLVLALGALPPPRRETGTARSDGFEAAHARALALLDENP